MIKKKISQIKLEQKSKSLKANSLISIFLKNKKTNPSISIDSKNSEQLKLIPNKTDNKSSKIILRQKTLLEQAKTNPNFYTNKTSNYNIIQNNKSYNLFKQYPLLKKIQKENQILNNKNKDYFTNSTNYNYESEIKVNKKDEFEISEEDKMFDQFLSKKKKQIKKVKIKGKYKIKKKKKLNNYNSYEAPLNKVYNKIPQIMNKIELTKKLKNSFSLIKYQNLLFDVGSKTLDWDSKVKLNNEFKHLRNITNKEYELLRKSVKEIEKKEKRIIDNINRQQDYYKKHMRENNYYCMTIGMNFHGISNLKFHKTVTKFKYKQKGIL